MAEEVLQQKESGGFVTDLAGTFNFLVDPTGAAKCLRRKWFWVAAILIVSAITIAITVYNMPLAQQAMANQPPPPNVSPEQFQKNMQIGMLFQKIFVYLAPVVIAVFDALAALILLATCAVIDVKARFLELFNFAAGLSLFDALKAIASTVIIHAKGEPSSMADLQPPLGFDIFMPSGANKVLVAFLGYFNVFEVWEIVMAVLIMAAAYRISKTKASVAIAPLFMLGMLAKLVGAFFSPKTT
jgi:hypothetical protein